MSCFKPVSRCIKVFYAIIKLGLQLNFSLKYGKKKCNAITTWEALHFIIFNQTCNLQANKEKPEIVETSYQELLSLLKTR